MQTSPLRVLIDGRMLLGRFSGVARVVTELVEQFARRPDVQPVVLCGDEPYQPWVSRPDVELLVSNFRREDRSPFRRFLWEQTQLAGWIRRSATDVYHAAWNGGIPNKTAVPTVLTIHDLIPWTQPVRRVRGLFERRCYRLSVSRSARRATVITTVSDFVRERIATTLGVDRSTIRTIYNGVSIPDGAPPAAPTIHTAADAPFVLYIGGHEPRKNVAAMLRAMRDYWTRYDENLALALTGTAGALCPAARRELESLPKEAPVRFLGSVTDTELVSLCARASVLLMLSTQEGFGLPVLEAMAHGCPVIAADRAALPEVVGDAGIVLSPDNAAGVVAAIRRVVTDPRRSASLVEAGIARARRFTWTSCGEAMVEAYRFALQKASATAASVFV